MCGIVAWSGSSPKKFNKYKFDILGLFNNTRGGDSVGVSTDGEIYYGTLLNKNYDDFIINKGYIVPQVIPAVIGHMRKASVGVVNETNAHPFGFGTLNEGFEFIGCHNGTLSNHEDLGKKYEVSTSVYNDQNHFQRNKVDSEVLLEILYKSRTTNVLEEYIGGAAIVFQDLNEPNKIYAFHGASKKEVGDRDEQHYEERPLYYYQESKDSVYISSMEEPLKFIGGVPGETLFEFDHNKLYEIVNGNVSKSLRHKVDRSGAGQRKGYASGFSTGGKNTGGTINQNFSHKNKRNHKKDRSKTKRLKRIENVSNIYDETVISDDFPSAIYYNKLRYWRNGHLISGVYTYVRQFGFYKIAEFASETNDKIYRLLGSYFSYKTGEFVNDKQIDELLKTDDTMFVPFDYAMKEPPLFYFINGIMLETVHDFIVMSSKNCPNFTFDQISQMSRYPICNIGKHRRPDDKQGIIHNAKPYTDSFVPVQCNNLYIIDNGNLVGIDRFEEEVVKEAEFCCSMAHAPGSVPVIQLPLNFEVVTPPINENLNQTKVHNSGVVDFLDKPTVEFLDEDPPIDGLNEEENSKVLDIINNHVMPIYEQIQVCNENLKNEHNDVVQEIVDLQKDFLISIDCIIESKEK